MGVGLVWRQAEDESRRRATPIKNDSRWRTRQGTERKKTDYAGRGERQKKKPHWRIGGVGEKKLNEALLRLADKESWGGH